MIEIVCTNKENIRKKYALGTTLDYIAEDLNIQLSYPILAAKVNNEVKSLQYEIYKSKIITFFDLSHISGYAVYERSMYFLLYKAIKDTYPDQDIIIKYSIVGGKYCEFENPDFEVNDEVVNNILQRMKAMVAADIPFVRTQMLTEEAIALYEQKKLFDKKQLLQHRDIFYTSVYYLEDTPNYFFGCLAPSTKYLTMFDLIKYESGLLLRMPSRHDPSKLIKQRESPKLFSIFKEHKKWNRIMEVPYVGALNDAVKQGKSTELLLIAEALQEKKITKIADEIAARDNIKMVLLSGPSSSGKTTICKRISVQLGVLGFKPVQLSLDNYFVEREFTPKDKEGKYDFEHIGAIDLNLFHEQISDLFAGKEIKIPTYDFHLGKKVWKGNSLQLKPGSILVVEGIHCLNPLVSQNVDSERIFKVFVSALTSLAMDKHNPIHSNDNRLIRRLVRDYRYRGYSAQESLCRWNSVRKGEEKWIFPFQEEADIMFNSAILCELSILKPFAMPLLNEVTEISDDFTEAMRLKKLLSYFIEIPEKDVPQSSILREFFGGSVFSYK
jgi:uridine kinase